MHIKDLVENPLFQFTVREVVGHNKAVELLERLEGLTEEELTMATGPIGINPRILRPADQVSRRSAPLSIGGESKPEGYKSINS